MNVGDLYNPKKLFTGIFVPEAMVRLTTISSGSKILFGRLCWHVNDDGECFPSRKALAEEIGVSESSVRDYLKELEDQAFIIRVRTGPSANSYDFPWNEVLESCLRKKHRQPSAGQEKPLIDSRVPLDGQPSVSPIISLVREDLREIEQPSSISPALLESPRATAKYAVNGWNRFPGLPSLKSAGARNSAEEDFRSKRIDISESDFDASLVAYAAKYRSDEDKPKIPWRYFLAGIHDWASTGPTGREFASGYQSVPFLVDLKAQYDAIGSDAIPSDFDKCVKECQKLSEADKAKALARVAEFDPAYIRRPLYFLKDREFDRRPRPEPKSKLQSLIEMA